MPKVDLYAIEQSTSTGYPPPYDRDVAGRHYRRVGKAMGLMRLGMSQCTLAPGACPCRLRFSTAGNAGRLGAPDAEDGARMVTTGRRELRPCSTVASCPAPISRIDAPFVIATSMPVDIGYSPGGR